MSHSFDPSRDETGDPRRDEASRDRDQGRARGPEASRSPAEGMHQPPDPRDLTRCPPESPLCARVRGLMRDYVDSDLAAALQAEVENHAHCCRTCAVALSRAEYEIHRLRSVYQGNWDAVSPRTGFARRVVARLLADTTKDREDTSRDRRLPMLPPIAAAAAAAADVAPRAAKVPARPARSVSRIFTAVGVLLLGVLGTFGWWWQGATELVASVRLSVVDARDAWSDTGDARHRLRSGDGLSDGDLLVVNGSGVAEALWHDESRTGPQPAASISVRGDGDADGLLRVQEGLPQLLRGDMMVSSQREMTVLLGDGSRVDLGKGEYRIRATQDASDITTLASESPLVSIEVLEGDSAMLLVGNGGGARIGPGQSGQYGGSFGGVAVQNLPSGVAAATPQPARRTEPSEPPRPDLVGVVVDTRSNAVVDSQVWLTWLGSANALTTSILRTNADGRFEVAAGSGLQRGFALVEVQAPHAGLAPAVRDAVRLRPTAAGRYEVAATVLEEAGRTFGTAVDASGRALAGVRVVPVLYDQILGLLWPWLPLAVSTNASGDFVLDGLPRSLPAQQCLCLVAFHHDGDVAVAAIPLPGSPAAVLAPVRLRVAGLRTVAVHGLPVGPCEIYEEVATAPVAGVMLRRHIAVSSPDGAIAGLAVGAGRLWLRAGSGVSPRLRRLVPGPVDNEFLAEPALTEHAAVFRLRVDAMTQTAAAGDQQLFVAAAERHGSFRHANAADTFFVFDAAATNAEHPVVDAQAFALTPLPSGGFAARFLGLQGADGVPWDFTSAETEVVVLARGSAVASSVHRLSTTGGRLLRLPAPGALQFDALQLPADRALQVRLTPLEQGQAGQRPPLFRFVGRAFPMAGELPPGDYALTDSLGRERSVVVQAGQITVVE